MYGPTETTIWSTVAQITDENDISIGHPIDETQVYVLDQQYQPVPVGVTGELFIGGSGLARGYWQRPDLDIEKFVVHPYGQNARLYRTGDYAQWLSDGRLVCLGRQDNQVKIRGFRIETADIEHHLLQTKGVRNAVVIARALGNGSGNDKELALVAYIVSDHELGMELEIEPQMLRQKLAESLPAYMVPSYFVAIDELPLGPTGKLLISELPDPIAINSSMDFSISSSEPVESAQTALEQQLCEQFSAVLGCVISVNDDFFLHGGHSLKAMALSARLSQTLGLEIRLADLFTWPTPRSLAQKLDSKQPVSYEAIPKAPLSEDYPLSDAQRRLWVAAQNTHSSIAYNMPAAIQLRGELNVNALEEAVRFLVDRHESLRTTFSVRRDEPRQIIHKQSLALLTRVDCRQQTDPVDYAKRWLAADSAVEFNLEQGPLFRAALLQIENCCHVLAFNMHHIVSDAWSMQVVARELTQAYSALDQGLVVELPEIRIQYRDYARWQNSQEQAGYFKNNHDYWTHKLKDLPYPELLSPDQPRTDKPRHQGTLVRRQLESSVVDKLRHLGRQQAGDLFSVLVASIRALLFRYSGQEDAVVACVTAGRNHPDVQDQVGFYVNTLLLRDCLNPEASFRDLLDQVSTTFNEALAHADYPFDRLGADLGMTGPLFQVMIDYQVNRDDADSMRELSVSPFGERQAASKFDVLFLFAEDDQGLRLTLEYDSDLFLPRSAPRRSNG